MPTASLLMLIWNLKFPFYYARGVLNFLAATVCCRALFGPDVWLRLVFYLDWVFGRLEADRDEIGNMIRQRRTRYMVLYVMLAAAGLTWLSFYMLDTDLHWIQLATGVAGGVGLYWGCLCGVSHGLPINMRIFL